VSSGGHFNIYKGAVGVSQRRNLVLIGRPVENLFDVLNSKDEQTITHTGVEKSTLTPIRSKTLYKSSSSRGVREHNTGNIAQIHTRKQLYTFSITCILSERVPRR